MHDLCLTCKEYSSVGLEEAFWTAVISPQKVVDGVHHQDNGNGPQQCQCVFERGGCAGDLQWRGNLVTCPVQLAAYYDFRFKASHD